MVACKLPNGLHLDVPGKGRVTLKGVMLPFGIAPDAPMPGGYTLTSVDEEFWQAWVARNAESDIVVKKIVFASARADHTRGMAAEQTEIKSGLEQLDANKPGASLERVGMTG